MFEILALYLDVQICHTNLTHLLSVCSKNSFPYLHFQSFFIPYFLSEFKCEHCSVVPHFKIFQSSLFSGFPIFYVSHLLLLYIFGTFCKSILNLETNGFSSRKIIFGITLSISGNSDTKHPTSSLH